MTKHVNKNFCVSAWCISNVVGFIYGLLVKNFECLLLNLMKPETLSTCSFLFTLLSDDVVSIDDDHWENCDVSDKDRLAHDKLTHDKGCETGIVEFVVKFRVNDKPAVNTQRVVKRTLESGSRRIGTIIYSDVGAHWWCHVGWLRRHRCPCGPRGLVNLSISRCVLQYKTISMSAAHTWPNLSLTLQSQWGDCSNGIEDS